MLSSGWCSPPCKVQEASNSCFSIHSSTREMHSVKCIEQYVGWKGDPVVKSIFYSFITKTLILFLAPTSSGPQPPAASVPEDSTPFVWSPQVPGTRMMHTHIKTNNSLKENSLCTASKMPLVRTRPCCQPYGMGSLPGIHRFVLWSANAAWLLEHRVCSMAIAVVPGSLWEPFTSHLWMHPNIFVT